MTTAGGQVAGHVVRYRRGARLFHAATYLVTFVLMATGWWLETGHEGDPSVLAELTEIPDTDLHRRVGWGLVALAGVALSVGVRAAVTFVRETLRADRGDGRWFLRWPAGVLTGRFAPHRGHFDPGQRVANVAFVVVFGVLVATGVGIAVLSGGPRYGALLRLHRVAADALAVLVAVHVVLALGLLPGYRGAWRSMHWRGRTPVPTARRLWPASVTAVDDDGASERCEADEPRAPNGSPRLRPGAIRTPGDAPSRGVPFDSHTSRRGDVSRG